MELFLKHDKELNEEERRACQRVDERAFAQQEHDDDDTQWINSCDWHVMVEDEGEIISHLLIVERNALVDGQPVRLGGIGSVGTLPEHRRRGCASLSMQMADEFMRREMGVDFGLLVTDLSLIPFYERLGWKVVPGPLVTDQPGRGKVPLECVIMVLPCARQDWPEGLIDLCGLPW